MVLQQPPNLRPPMVVARVKFKRADFVTMDVPPIISPPGGFSHDGGIQPLRTIAKACGGLLGGQSALPKQMPLHLVSELHPELLRFTQPMKQSRRTQVIIKGQRVGL